MGAIQIPTLFRGQFQIASEGDAYLIPCAAGSIDATRSGTYFVRRRPGEIPVSGARRVENALARVSSWANGFPGWDPRAWNGQFGSGAVWEVEAGYPGPSGRANGAVRVRRNDSPGIFRSIYTDLNGIGVASYATRIAALWARSITGSIGLAGITNHSGVQYVAVPTVWTRIGMLGSGVMWPPRIGIASPGSGTVDLLIAIEEGWRAQIEVYPGSFYPHGLGPCEAVDPAVDYSLIDGCGGLGIRYFDTYNLNVFSASRHVVEATGGRIPDIHGILPRAGITNRALANNPVGSPVGIMSTFLDHFPSSVEQTGDLESALLVYNASLGLDFWRRTWWSITANSGLQWGFSALVKPVSCTHCCVYYYAAPASGAVINLAVMVPITGSSPFYTAINSLGVQLVVAGEPMGASWWWIKVAGTVGSGGPSTTISVAPNSGGAGVNQLAGTSMLLAGPTLYEGGMLPPFPMISRSASAVSLADDLSINSLACGDRFTIFVEGYIPVETGRGYPNAVSQRLVADGNASAVPALYVQFHNGAIAAQIGPSGIAMGGLVTTSPGVFRAALVRDGAYGALWLNGACVGTVAATSSMVVRGLGQTAAQRHGNVGLRQVRVYPTFAAHAELAARLTASGSTL